MKISTSQQHLIYRLQMPIKLLTKEIKNNSKFFLENKN